MDIQQQQLSRKSGFAADTMPKRSEVPGSEAQRDLNATPIKEPRSKKQKVLSGVVSKDKRPASPRVSKQPSQQVLGQLVNLNQEFGIKNGSRIEILWSSESGGEDVWWPCTINIPPEALHEIGTTIISGEEDNGDVIEFELVSIPVTYDFHSSFPEYTGEELDSCISIIHDHKLLENAVEKEALWRFEGSKWSYDEGICLDIDGNKKTPIEMVPEKLADTLINQLMVPLFEKKKHLLGHVQRIFCAERVRTVRNIFIGELKRRQREDRGYIACMDDVELKDLLQFAAEKEKKGRGLSGLL